MKWRTPPPSPEHWSKDYVEHLRGVHFALLTVSAGLILLLTSKSYNARAAAEQMDQVIKSSSTSPDLENSRTFSASKLQGIPITDNWFVGRVETTNEKIRFRIVESNLFFCGYSYERFDTKHIARNLREFREFWNRFISDKPVLVDSVTAVAASGISYWTKPSDVEKIATQLPIKGDESLKVVELGLATQPCPYGKENPLDKYKIGLFGTTDQRIYNFDVAGLLRSEMSPPVTDAERVGPDLYFHLSSVAPFESRFPDLSKAAQDRMNEDFATLGPEIHLEANKGEEAFEAFGIKFPSEQVTRWGILVLVCVQLYLFMYLRRLYSKLKPDDPAWDVPWMAMDQSLIARVMFFVSIVGLPICAASVVAIRALQEVPRYYSNVMSFSFWAAIRGLLYYLQHSCWILIGVVASVILSCFSWKYRPKLTEPVAPAQLFE